MAQTRTIQWGKAVSWGAYLACSWTWCIGMFLPILLVRDHGQPGWWAFAIPNVLGAAAMGWVLRSSLSASRTRASHLPAARAFSLVTIAFHCFFIAWMGGILFPIEVLPPIVLLIGIVGSACVLLGPGVRWLAVLVWLLSACVLALLAWTMPEAIVQTLSTRGELPSTNVLWLTPVCVLGFALCPYLDLTFLRARRVCDGPTGAAAFTIGFGVLFATMIVLTLAYRAMFRPELLELGLGQRPLWAVLCLGHIALQSAFTIGVHIVELATPEPARRLMTEARADEEHAAIPDDSTARPMPLGRTLLLLAMLISALLGAAAQSWPTLGAMPAGEVAYRCFMSAYGLVFPAYVWLCMVPRGRADLNALNANANPLDRAGARGLVRPTRRALMVWVVTVALAAPFYAAGFLWRETIWLAPGVLIVLLARLFVGRRPANR